MTAASLMTMPGPAAYSRQEAAAGPARPDPYETTRETTSMSDTASHDHTNHRDMVLGQTTITATPLLCGGVR
ncbi:hypothetical protein [Saccharothrix deserti]|uniref:hypothetical protein n=1 Tax=Saccharothrix deserti TaxID=2593674 RepID=UPI00131C8E9B|nr:hypothetical protein [Saccharothrix deserti]